MNGAQATTPSTASPVWEDAICAIGFGSDLTSGSGNESNTFGNGVLINGGTQILCAVHVLPFNSSGYHTLPRDTSTTARICRFRRLLNGTAPVDGTAANSFQVYISGYRVASPNSDIALCDLATTVTHIAPIAVDSGVPANGDGITLDGWGSTSATLFTVVRPNDVREITGKTITNVTTNDSGLVSQFSWSGTNPGPNIYDSGSPVMRTVGGNPAVTGIVSGSTGGPALQRHAHDTTLQIPGLYTPSVAPPADPSTWLRSNDTFIDSADPTGNASASTGMTVEQTLGKGASEKRLLFAGFNIGALGKTPKSSRLVLTLANPTTAMHLTAYRILRHGTTALANWNTYDGTNNWGTAGASNTTSDIDITKLSVLTLDGTEAAGQQVVFSGAGLDAMVAAALADDGILRLLIVTDDTSGFPIGFYSNDAGLVGLRPYLEVTYADNSGKLSRAGRVEARAARIARV